MYIIIGQETHPDRFLEQKAYGPFESFAQADHFANEHAARPGNQLKHRFGGRMYSYSVIELVKP